MRFATDISLFWLLPWVVVSILLAIWLYSNSNWFKGLGKNMRVLLQTLRALSLFLIGVLLFGIIFEAVSYRIEKPIIINMIDISKSMKNYKDSSEVTDLVNKLRTSLQEDLDESFEVVDMVVGTQAEYGKFDGFKAGESNLSAGFEKIQTDYYNRNIGGILFVSDGNLISGVGRLPFNTDGGGLCNNHPNNRGGMTKVIEAVRQLRGEAHPRVQVPDCLLALAHGTGGSIGTRMGSATLILGGNNA